MCILEQLHLDTKVQPSRGVDEPLKRDLKLETTLDSDSLHRSRAVICESEFLHMVLRFDLIFDGFKQ